MIRYLAALMVLALTGCARDSTLGPDEIAQVERVLDDFRQAWLDQDSARVMRQVSPDVTMFVPGTGAPTISGKDQLRTYWFPADGKAYPIRKYTVTHQSVYGAGRYAVAQGVSDLAWDTTVRDSVVSSATSKSEFLTVLRKENGGWMIYRQMFVLR